MKASPAKTTRPTRSPLSESSSEVSSSLARSSREGVTSRAYIDFDASSATTTSMPRRLATSAFSPHWGWASARAKKTSAMV